MSRVRTQDDTSRWPNWRGESYRTSEAEGKYTAWSNSGTSNVFVGRKKSMTDNPTPGYAKAVKAGTIVNTPYGSTETLEQCTSCPTFSLYCGKTGLGHTYWDWYNTNAIASVGQWWGGNPANPDAISKARRLAIVQCLSNIGKPDAMVGVTIGELKETVALLKNPFGKFVDLVRWLRAQWKSKAKRAISFWDWLVGTWLEYRYAWRPLIGEIAGYLKAINSLKNKVPPMQTARGSASEFVSRQIATRYTASVSPYLGADCSVDQNFTATSKAKVLYSVKPEWAGIQTFGLDSPLSTAWELVTLSFVVDWFTNIGDWLRALEPRLGVSILAYSIEDTTDDFFNLQAISPVYPKNWQLNVFTPAQWSKLVRTKSRDTRPFSVPVRPDITVKLDVAKVIDLIAIGQQLLRKK